MKDEIKVEIRSKEQQAIDNLKSIINSKDKTIEIEPPLEDTAQILLDYITNLQEIRKEHNIMKQFIYENGLWEKFLNDDRFLEHLRSDDNE